MVRWGLVQIYLKIGEEHSALPRFFLLKRSQSFLETIAIPKGNDGYCFLLSWPSLDGRIVSDYKSCATAS